METTTNETKPSRNLTEAARCAADIRRVLKAAFPAIKFRVTSSNYSMGDSVYVKWTDGPTCDAVETLTARFSGGHFDGQQDMYISAPSDVATPNRAKFVSCDRAVSPAIRAALESDIAKMFTAAELSNFDVGDWAYQILRRSDLSGGYLALHYGDAGWEIIEERPIARQKAAA